jgi:hypothetical protein
MKVTRGRLRQIIKEEFSRLNESSTFISGWDTMSIEDKVDQLARIMEFWQEDIESISIADGKAEAV